MSNKPSDAGRGLCLDAALAYAGRGWPVFPCDPTSKKPYTDHGFKDATTNPAVIRDWWSRWPKAMIGVPTGAPISSFILDIDVKHDGFKALDALIKANGAIPKTVWARTQSGGDHFYFKLPGDKCIRNSVSRLGKGLDVRGDGGYVIVPPSLGANGAYTWINAPKEAPIVDSPDWLLRLLTSPVGGPNRSNSATPVEDAITEGRRNVTLTSYAGSMRHVGMEPGEMLFELRKVNAQRCRPPLDDAELHQIAESVGKYPSGKAKPDTRNNRRRGRGTATPVEAPAPQKPFQSTPTERWQKAGPGFCGGLEEAIRGAITADKSTMSAIAETLDRATRDARLGTSWSRAVFTLAQGLKGIEPLATAGRDDLHRLVVVWHQAALGDRVDLADVLAAFWAAWDRVRFPCRRRDSARVENTFAEAASNPPAHIKELAAARYPGSRRLIQVMAVCHAAHTLTGGEPWFVPCRTLMRVLDLSSWKEPAGWLKLLACDGIIRQVKLGTSRCSPRYRWIGDRCGVHDGHMKEEKDQC